MLTACATIDSDWPEEEPGLRPFDMGSNGGEADPFDDEPVQLGDDDWDQFLADDDYEPEPDLGDFWTDVADD